MPGILDLTFLMVLSTLAIFLDFLDLLDLPELFVLYATWEPPKRLVRCLVSIACFHHSIKYSRT